MCLFLFRISNLSARISVIKCLKSISAKYDVIVSSEPLQNLCESINLMFLLTKMLIYLSIVLGNTSTSTKKLFKSLILSNYENTFKL